MDEPLVHVDPARAGNYWQAIRRQLDATGASLIFSTHVAETVLGEAQNVVCLREGQVRYAGSVHELYWHPATVELAEFLGPMNWLSPAEARLWLESEEEGSRGWRPEQLALAPVPASPIVVESSRFRGSVAETELRHPATGSTRRFFHRPSGDHFRPGLPVIARVLLFLFAFVLAGCHRAAVGDITVRAVHSWILPAEGAMLPSPRSVAIGKNDEFAVLDTGGRVLVYDAAGTLLRRWTMPDITVGKPEGVCILADGRVIVCDTHYHRVVYFDAQGKVVHAFGGMGNGPGEFIYPVGIAKDDRENLYVCEYGGNDRVQEFTRDGVFIRAFGGFGTGPGQFQRPSGLCWHAGEVYVADAINNRVLVFTEGGKYERILGEGGHPLPVQFPYGIAFGGDGDFYVIEYGAGRLTRVSPEGRLLGRFGSTGLGEGQFSTPWGLAIDSKMRVRVADTKNRRIVTCEL